VKRYVYPAQNQFSPFCKPVNIVTLANAKIQKTISLKFVWDDYNLFGGCLHGFIMEYRKIFVI